MNWIVNDPAAMLQPQHVVHRVAPGRLARKQMGLPYLLMARGLRVVNSQEAGVITLLEPLLNPLWAYLVAPQKENPTTCTFVGGALILGALAWRYWPGKSV